MTLCRLWYSRRKHLEDRCQAGSDDAGSQGDTKLGGFGGSLTPATNNHQQLSTNHQQTINEPATNHQRTSKQPINKPATTPSFFRQNSYIVMGTRSSRLMSRSSSPCPPMHCWPRACHASRTMAFFCWSPRQVVEPRCKAGMRFSVDQRGSGRYWVFRNYSINVPNMCLLCLAILGIP